MSAATVPNSVLVEFLLTFIEFCRYFSVFFHSLLFVFIRFVLCFYAVFAQIVFIGEQ